MTSALTDTTSARSVSPTRQLAAVESAAGTEMHPVNQLILLVAASALGFAGIGAIAYGASRAAVRDRTSLFVGTFSTLYAIRLLAGSELVLDVSAIPSLAAIHVREAINYLILAPLSVAAWLLFAPDNRLVRALWQVDVAYGVAAVVVDLATGRPGALSALNPLAVGINFAVLLPLLARQFRRTTWTKGRAAAAAGLLLFVALAALETFVGRSVLVPRVNLEPVGMMAFTAGLGWFVGERIVAGERRLVAVSQELATARRIQQTILPDGVPRLAGLEVAATLLPMSEVAGDFYDFLPTGDGALGVLVADVSGHGVPAAIVASMVKVALASEADHAHDPGELMTRLNRTLTGKFDFAFVTAVYACFEPRTRMLSYASAGHPPPLVRRASGELASLDQGDLAVGFSVSARYSTYRRPLEAGDCVLLYTDGVTEAEGRDGAFFGDRRFADVVARSAPGTSVALVDAVLRELALWKAKPGDELADDVTIVAVAIE